jgi:hypothetical protein
MPRNHLISEYMGKRIDTPANPEPTVSQQIFEDLRAQSRKNKPEFKMPMGPPQVRKVMPLTPKRVIPQRMAVGGKQSVQTNHRTTALLGGGSIPAGKSSVRNNAHLLKFDKPEDLF